MKLHHIFAGVTLASFVSYMVWATIDTKYALSYNLAQKLPF